MLERRLSTFPTSISGVCLVRREHRGDERGFFSRLFCAEELALLGWNNPISQVNHTFTKSAGTVRGMHFQVPPFAEVKLVTCLTGTVWDVVVDLRRNSPTFLRSFGHELSAQNKTAMLIPEGCAHGFQALADDTMLLYCHSKPYAAEAERGIHPEDPMLGIIWPMSISSLSNKDESRKMLPSEWNGILL